MIRIQSSARGIRMNKYSPVGDQNPSRAQVVVRRMKRAATPMNRSLSTRGPVRFAHAAVWLNQAVLELPRRCKARGRPRSSARKRTVRYVRFMHMLSLIPQVWATSISTATVSPAVRKLDGESRGYASSTLITRRLLWAISGRTDVV